MTETTGADPAPQAPPDDGDAPATPSEPRRMNWRLCALLAFVALVGVGCNGIFTPSYCRTSPLNCSRVAYHQYLEPLLDREVVTEADIPSRIDADAVRRSAPNPAQPAGSAIDVPFYGMQYVPTSDLDQVASLGVNTVLQDFPRDDPAAWIEILDAAATRDMKVVAWQWPSGWDWNESTETWTVTPAGRRFIETVADHPALLAVYGVHEPYWNDCFGCGWESKDLRQLYQKIKAVRDVPVYAAFDGFDYWRDFSPATTFGPGICDICDTWYYPVLDEDYDRDEYVERLATELSLFRELAPDSKFVWVVQAFSSDLSGRSMPTAFQMREMVDLALWADVDGIWWYTWDFDRRQYQDVLSDRPDLQRVVGESYNDFLDLLCPSNGRVNATSISSSPGASECDQ